MGPKGARWIAGFAAAAAVLAAPSAHAAVTFGETFTPTNPLGVGNTFVQSTSPGGQYAAPTDGVITAWSFQAGPDPPQLKLKVVRPAAAANTFTVVGDGPVETPAPNQLSTFVNVRIPVQAGDLLGFYTVTDNKNAYRVVPNYLFQALPADAPVGSTSLYPGPFMVTQLDVSARLEPDCDEDGLGDETQDPELADTFAACDRNAPSAAITGRPKDKTKKKTATFEFSGSDTRALAGFECSLDGESFRACSSPVTYEVKKGKHSFAVRAIDRAGNVGAAATDDWKVKKKKKR